MIGVLHVSKPPIAADSHGHSNAHVPSMFTSETWPKLTQTQAVQCLGAQVGHAFRTKLKTWQRCASGPLGMAWHGAYALQY